MVIQSHLSINASTRPTEKSSDSELVALIRNGNDEAFEIVMRRHNLRLYRLARSILREDHEAMDVVQETYVKAYYLLHQFKGPDGFISWLSRIASNEAIMRIRKSKRISYTLDDSSENVYEIQSPNSDPMENLANLQLRNMLENAIDNLPLDYRSVYVMRAIQQLSTLETAESLDITADTVKTRYLRAKRALQKKFESHMEKTGLDVFEFAGQRCDWIIKTVTTRIHINEES